MPTLSVFEEAWICLMLVGMLTAQAHVALLTPAQVALLHQLRARLHATGPGIAGALEACADIDGLLAHLEET